jgi:capsid protein
VMDAIRRTTGTHGSLRRTATRLRPCALPAAHPRRTLLRKLKQFRAVATRYDKRECIYQGTIDATSIRIWLRDRHMIYKTPPSTHTRPVCAAVPVGRLAVRAASERSF